MELKRGAGSIDSKTGVATQVVNGGSFRASQEMGPKAKGRRVVRRVVLRTFDGLVQQRMERTFGAITLSHQATPPRASVLSDPLVVSTLPTSEAGQPLDKLRDRCFLLQ